MGKFSGKYIESIISQIKLRIEDLIKTYAFAQFNDESTRMSIRNVISVELHSLFMNGDISEYRVICDAFNNSPFVINQNELRLVVQLKFHTSPNSFYIDVLVSPKEIEIIDKCFTA
jgi:hypothetical protein